MQPVKYRTRMVALASFIALAAACSSSTSSAPQPQQLVVSAERTSLAKGTAVPLSATAQYSDKTTKDVLADVQWTSSDPSVVAVQGGAARGLTAGQATLTAKLDKLQATLDLKVTAAEVVSLAVTPGEVSAPKGVVQTVAVTGTFTDDTVQDVTANVTWTSSAPDIAAAEAGNVAARGEGAADLVASYGGKSATVHVNVTAAVLTAVHVDQAILVVPVGLVRQLTATGIYSDGTAKDVTALAAWTSSDPAVVTVTAAGLATMAAQGHAIVTATVGTLSGTADVTVNPTKLLSVAIGANPLQMPKGTMQALTATGTYDNGTTADLTTNVMWQSSAPAVLAVSDVAGSKGQARALTVGTATVTATPPCDCAVGTLDLTVTPAVVTAVAIAPPTLTLPAGLSARFGATATYTDGTTGDVTKTVTWSTSDGTIATVSNAAPDQGKLSALAPGAITLTAIEPDSKVQATAAVTISNAALLELTITPPTVVIPLGLTSSLKATGRYTDQRTYDVTENLVWTSSAPAAAAVSNSAGTRGVVTGLAKATDVVVTATEPTTQLSATAGVTVSDAALLRMEIAPATASIAKGRSQPFAATGFYSDHTTADLTTAVTWSCSDTDVAHISNAAGTHGLATTGAWSDTGTVTISAFMTSPYVPNGVTANASLTVTPAVLVRLVINADHTYVPRWLPLPFTATGIYSDDTRADVTADVTWASEHPDIAPVSNAAADKGVVTGIAVGFTRIQALDPTTQILSNRFPVHVTAAELRDVTVTPFTASVPKGLTRQYHALGTYYDATTHLLWFYDLTPFVTWSTQDWPDATLTPVASVSNVKGTNGLVTALGLGGATVTATEPATGKTGWAEFHATDAVMVSIAVLPADATIAKGLTQQFQAMATYTDQSVLDVTEHVQWHSSSIEVAGISNNASDRGRAMALGVGQVTISAGASAGVHGAWVMGSTTLTVSPAELRSITVSPAAPTVALGQLQPFVAVGLYTDGNRVITAAVVWDSSDPDVATVSNAAGSYGVAASHAVGSTTITAIDATTGIYGQAVLTVGPLAMVRLDVEVPSPGYVLPGHTLQLTANATWSDGSASDVTAGVGWTSSDPTTLTVAGGLVTGVENGTALVTATDPVSGVFGTARVPVGSIPTARR